MYSLIVLEGRHLKSRCWQGHAPSRGFREDSFLAPSSFWWHQASLPCSYIPPTVFFFIWPPPSLSVFSLLSITKVLVIGFPAHWRIQMILSQDPFTTSGKTLFPNKVTFPVPGVTMWTYLFGCHHSTHYTALIFILPLPLDPYTQPRNMVKLPHQKKNKFSPIALSSCAILHFYAQLLISLKSNLYLLPPFLNYHLIFSCLLFFPAYF